MELAYLDHVDIDKVVLYSEFHFYLSGNVEPSLGGNSYTIQFFEPTSSISDVRMMKQRSDTSAEVKSYILC